jgi:hypothetical protein
MISRLCLLRGIRRLVLSLLVLPLFWAGQAGAADVCKLRFSATPNPDDAQKLPLWRPNQTQDYYLFVENVTGKLEEVTVEILAGGKPIDGGSAIVKANPNGLTPVPLGKPPMPQPPPPVPAAPPVPPAPPQLAEVKGTVRFVVSSKNAAKRGDFDDVTLVLAKPSDYVEVLVAKYDLKEEAGIKNQLVIKVRAKTDFQGGRCRVDIALNPSRIPGFVDTPKKEGTRGGYLQQAGDELTLTANNLQFRDVAGKPDEKLDGVVYLTIDGYERAFIYKSTFLRSGITKSDLDQIRIPVARLKAAPSADPAKPYPVAVELDNATPEFDKDGKVIIGPVVEIGLDRDGNGKFEKKSGEVIPLGIGNRLEQMFFNPAFPNGAFQFKSIVTDWSTNLDVAGIYGPRLVRLRLVKDETEIAKPNDEDRKLVQILNGATDMAGFDITETVVFDGTKPENLKFVDFPEKLARGSLLPVKATAVDPESGIAEAVFYIGKPGPDGKPPATAVKVAGTLMDAKTGVWAAALDAPTEQKGKVDVTAQFTNGAGLVATETVVIQLVDSLPDGKGGGKASIEGKVLQGDRPQPKVPVFLRDAAGGVKDTTVTDDKGGFIFKDVPPATYRVFASKTGDNTKGETIVQVQEGQNKKDVSVSLVR